MPMLSKLELARLARDCGLSQWADGLVSTVSVGWELAATDARPPSPGTSKIGGLPDLAPGEDWPLNARGIPMTLMAQLDLSALAPPPEGWALEEASWSPPRGLMRIFADLVDSPVDVCRASVLLCPPASPLKAAPLPALPDPWPLGGPCDEVEPEERYRRFAEIAVIFRPFLSGPEIFHGIRSEVWDTSPGPAQDYQRWLDRLRTDDDGREVTHALLGTHRSLQADVREWAALNFEEFFAAEADEDLTSADAWRPLLSLFDDDALDLRIADGGSFIVLAPAQDLAEGRFDRLLCVPETA
jgi:hypothetical protein